jgi:hypothetical protein
VTHRLVKTDAVGRLVIPGHYEQLRRLARPIVHMNAVDIVGDELCPRCRRRLNRQLLGVFLAVGDVPVSTMKVDAGNRAAGVQPAVQWEASISQRIELGNERGVDEMSINVRVTTKRRA